MFFLDGIDHNWSFRWISSTGLRRWSFVELATGDTLYLKRKIMRFYVWNDFRFRWDFINFIHFITIFNSMICWLDSCSKLLSGVSLNVFLLIWYQMILYTPVLIQENKWLNVTDMCQTPDIPTFVLKCRCYVAYKYGGNVRVYRVWSTWDFSFYFFCLCFTGFWMLV